MYSLKKCPLFLHFLLCISFFCRLRIIDDPIKPVYPEEANQGLWGGEGLVHGLIRKKKNKPR